MHWETLWDLILVFGQASLLALGGGTAVLGELQRESVGHYAWLNGKQFVNVFAITQATPGPSMLIVSLIGYWAMAQQFPTQPVFAVLAGLLGAVVATTAMFLPACLLAYYVGGWWEHFHSSNWRVPVEKALSAVTVGLLFASAVIISNDATVHNVKPDHSQAAMAGSSITAPATSANADMMDANRPSPAMVEINWKAWLVIAISAFLLAFTKVNPLVLMAIAGALGYMELI